MSKQRTGLIAGVAAYTLWGLLPIYWRSMSPATPFEVLAHRVVWSVVWVGLFLLVVRRFAEVRAVLRDWRTAMILVAASIAIAANWGIFIWSVNHGQTVEASLGYYMNPLVSVALGVVVFAERLRWLQWIAIGIAAVAVLVLTIEVGTFPFLSIALALSFGAYGALKKLSPTLPLPGLMVEALVLLPAALGLIGYLMVAGQSSFGHNGFVHTVLIMAAGVVTAVPLVLFAVSTQAIPLSTVGVLQYITPTLQLLIAVLVFDESMSAGRWYGFAIIWLALAVFSYDALRHAGRARRTKADELAATADAA